MSALTREFLLLETQPRRDHTGYKKITSTCKKGKEYMDIFVVAQIPFIKLERQHKYSKVCLGHRL